MIATCVDVYVVTDHIDDFIVAIRKNHLGSVQEPENLRFDILQDPDDPSHREGVAAHKETAHYLEWRETVADWMAAPRKGTPYTILFPESQSDT
jgi:(4S)-4-hydroxy-5-phosphonooxypentane-2,3-dione isomerase